MDGSITEKEDKQSLEREHRSAELTYNDHEIPHWRNLSQAHCASCHLHPGFEMRMCSSPSSAELESRGCLEASRDGVSRAAAWKQDRGQATR